MNQEICREHQVRVHQHFMKCACTFDKVWYMHTVNDAAAHTSSLGMQSTPKELGVYISRQVSHLIWCAVHISFLQLIYTMVWAVFCHFYIWCFVCFSAAEVVVNCWILYSRFRSGRHMMRCFAGHLFLVLRWYSSNICICHGVLWILILYHWIYMACIWVTLSMSQH